MKEPISIIIPAYKTQAFIQECLDSLESQTYFQDFNNYEILVASDGCYETFAKLQEIAHNYRNLSIFLMKNNHGPYVTINTLLEIAKYKWALIFGSDDIAMNHMIETIMLNKDSGNILQFGYYNFKDSIILQENIDYNHFRMAHGTVLIDKDVVLEHGGYQPWKCGADTELLKRLSRKLRGISITIPLFYRRLHDSSLTHTMNENNSERKRIIKIVSNMDVGDDPYIELITGKYECIPTK